MMTAVYDLTVTVSVTDLTAALRAGRKICAGPRLDRDLVLNVWLMEPSNNRIRISIAQATVSGTAVTVTAMVLGTASSSPTFVTATGMVQLLDATGNEEDSDVAHALLEVEIIVPTVDFSTRKDATGLIASVAVMVPITVPLD